ncbi:hypothetical protein MKY98_07935 [Paenibacillus sp. FSL M8-0228]|uniref:hypothetical protein n=1 Tax=Paenibacillus sp. FSL M8-0228 TaxID=2921620 RepID=UPI0030FA8D24
MGQRFRQTTVIFLVLFVLLISGCATKQIQTSDSEITNDPQDDIVYVDDETRFIATTLKLARLYDDVKEDFDMQETIASAVESSAESFDKDVKEKFIEVAAAIKDGDPEKTQRLCDEIEEKYVTKYSWKRDS